MTIETNKIWQIMFLGVWLVATFAAKDLSAQTTINNGTTGNGLNQFNYVGDWYANSGFMQGQTVGDYVTLNFTGTHIEVWCGEGHFDGIGAVSFDGGNEALFATQGANGNQQAGALVYTSPRLALGNHIMKLRVTGETYGYPSEDFFIQLYQAVVYNNGTVVDPPITAPSYPTNNAFNVIPAGDCNTWYLTVPAYAGPEGTPMLSWTAPNAYASYNVNYGTGANGVNFKAALPSTSVCCGGAIGGTVQVQLDSQTGPIVATCTVPNGPLNQWNVYSANLTTNVSGVHQTYLLFAQPQGYAPFNLDYFQFTPGVIVNVTGISVSPASVSIAGGASSQLAATMTPTNASNPTVTWTSSDPAVAEVNSSGVVTGITAGTATITATTQDGNHTASSTVTVTSSAPYSIVNIGNAGDGMTLGYTAGSDAYDWNASSENGDINGDAVFLTGSGAYLQYTFMGIGVDVIGRFPGPSYAANYAISIDGNMVYTGSTTNPAQYQGNYGSATGLINGSHAIKIADTGGAEWSTFVILDALKIYHAVAASPPVISSMRMAVNGSSFTLIGSGGASQKYVLAGTSSLTQPVTWEILLTNVADGNGAFSFTDLGTTNYSHRFYRVQQGQ